MAGQLLGTVKAMVVIPSPTEKHSDHSYKDYQKTRSSLTPALIFVAFAFTLQIHSGLGARG